MRVGFVVPRYGVEVNGGAERLCRDVAERMAKHWDVEIVTTCAVDYLTWRDEYGAGDDVVNGVTVRRFPVDRPRDLATFNRLSERLYTQPRTSEAELEWMRAQGPCSSALLAYVREHAKDFDWWLYFTYLYATTFFGLPLAKDRSLLVPAAHDEPPIYLDIFRDVFRQPRGLIFSTPEEQDFVNGRFETRDVPQDVIGVGIDPPAAADAERFRRAHAARLQGHKFILYAGRIDPSKGCDHLFEYFQRYRRDVAEPPIKLVLIGTPAMEMPALEDVIHLGFVTDEEKFDAMAAAEALVIPSPYESLSIVALEAWQVARPVLVNGVGEVLRGQCLRSNGGLWYDSYSEFREALHLLLSRPDVAAALGRSGCAFVGKRYRWSAIEEKYLALIDRLAGRG